MKNLYFRFLCVKHFITQNAIKEIFFDDIGLKEYIRKECKILRKQKQKIVIFVVLKLIFV